MTTRINFLTLFLLLTALIALNGCTSIYNGNIAGSTVISNGTYRHLGTVTASNRCVYVFHIGGNGKNSQIIKLKEDLQKRYPLRYGLAWTNVAVEMKTGFFVLWDVRKATLSVDLVDFWPDTNTAYSNYNGYYLNDSVFIPTPQNIAQIDNYQTYNVFYRLAFLNASKQNALATGLSKAEYDDVVLDKEIVFYYRRKPIYGIVNWKEDNYASIDYIDENGKLKNLKRHIDRLYKRDTN